MTGETKRQSTSVAISVVLFLLLRLVGEAIASALSPTAALAAEAATLLLSALFPLLLFLWMRPCAASAVGFRLPRKRDLRYLLLLPLFIVSVSLLASALTAVFERLGYRYEPALSSDPLHLLVFAALLPALSEELLCRYLCIAPLGGGRPTGAVWISAILFSVLHTNPVQIPYALFAGLFLGAVAVLTRSVWVPILFHLTNNLVSAVFILLGEGVGRSLFEGVLLSLAVLSIPLLLCRWKRSGSILSALLDAVRPRKSDLLLILEHLLSPISIPILLCLWLTTISCFS